jgi:hypothetical protein
VGLFHEPSAALVGGLEDEGGFVEEIEGGRGGGGFFREALEREERAVFGRVDGEGLKRVGRGAFQEDKGIGLEAGGGQDGKGGRRTEKADGKGERRKAKGGRRKAKGERRKAEGGEDVVSRETRRRAQAAGG